MALLAVAVTDVLKRAIYLIGGSAGKEKMPMRSKDPVGEDTNDAISSLRKKAANMRLEEEGRMM